MFPDAPSPPAPPDLASDQALVDLPDPFPATALALSQLADLLGHAATALFDDRRDHPSAPDLDRTLALESALDQRTIALRAGAVHLLGVQADDALAELRDATGRADAFLAGLQGLEARLALGGAVLALADATLAGDAAGILAAVDEVRSTLASRRES